jgi:hypothetical protein
MENQKTQIQLNDAKAMQASYQQWVKMQSAPQSPATGAASASDTSAAAPSSGSSSALPNYDDLITLAMKNGASAQAIQPLTEYVSKLKNQAAETAMDDARAGTSNAETMKTKNGMIVDAMNGVLNTPDAQLPQAIQQTAQQLSHNGLFDPSHVQQAMQLATLAQQNPGQARQQLEIQAKSLGGYAQLLDAAQKKITFQNAQGKTDPNSPLYEPSAASIAMGTAPGAEQIQQGEVNQAVRMQTNPQIQQGKVQVAAAEGAARANVEAQAARGSDAALAMVPPHLVAPATAAATKAGEDYAQAQSVTQTLQQMLAAAKSGNVVSYKIIPQEGALQITTSQGVHRINMAEIQNYGGGSWLQRLQGHLGGALTGRSFPTSVLSDMAQMQDVMQRGSQAKYENDLSTINQTYGAKFKPVEPVQVNPPTQNASPAAAPTPQTHQFSLGAWRAANPKGDPNAAKAAAQQQGYQVIP